MTATVDYSWSYPGAGTIAGAGYVGAERYLGNDGRCLQGWERDELLQAGVGIGLIWELAADRTLSGYNAGYSDARSANTYADNLAAPSSTPIRYATDFHASQSQIDGPITEYHRGVRDAGGRPVGVYGGAPVIDRMKAVFGMRYGWQAAAASWSNYTLSPHAVLLQEVNQIWGGAADVNTVLVPDNQIDWLWGRVSGDWFDMATKEDLQQIVDASVNRALADNYVGPRLLKLPNDPAVFEVVLVDGEHKRRHIPSPEQADGFQWGDIIAGKPGDMARVIPDQYVRVFESMPWV